MEGKSDGKDKDPSENNADVENPPIDTTKAKDNVRGGLQIYRNDTLEERASQFRVGGITYALLEPQGVTKKLNAGNVIHEDEPVFPTQSRIDRLKENARNKDTCSNRLRLRAASLDLWAVHSMPSGDTLAFNLCVALAPILLLLTIWDLMAVIIFAMPHLSTLNRPGVLYPFYPIGTVVSFYGYMMRFLMEDISRKRSICLAGVFVYPFLLILRCIIHYYFNGFRDERKVWY